MSMLRINTALPSRPEARVMIIYTGGTFGMTYDAAGVLKPFDFAHILDQLPVLKGLKLELNVVAFEQPIDSSNVEPGHWQEIARIIGQHYDTQDGFVVLHGTDTMAFTASALAFMLKNLAKPVVFTGAQLPISDPRSDARENLITALEIASAGPVSGVVVPEVCIYFDYELIRGCRSKKAETMHFDAFRSENYPVLAKAGVKIDYDKAAIRQAGKGPLELLTRFDTSIAVLKIFPGISKEVVSAVVRQPGLKALIIETFGSGNAPTADWFIGILRAAIANGLLVLNITQCPGGTVMQGKYETSRALNEIGVIGGGDMTVEAALTKTMLLMGSFGVEETRSMITRSLAGEITS